MRILIGTPAGDTCSSLFKQCSDMMMGYMARSGVDFAVDTEVSNNLPLNHNTLCAKAQKFGCDYLFHVETDVLFPPDAALRLASLEKDIAGCAIAFKTQSEPHKPSGYELDGSMVSCGSKQAPREVLKLSTSCLLISRKVIETLEPPLFRYGYDETLKASETPDFLFCNRARAAGFQIWMDPKLSLELGHVGSWVYTLKDADAA